MKANILLRLVLIILPLELWICNGWAQEQSALIRVVEGQSVVEFVDTSEIELLPNQTGLIIWAEGNRERWQMFKSKWSRPEQSSPSGLEINLASFSRSESVHAPINADSGQLTTLLPQVRSAEVFRGVGNLVTPYQGAFIFDPKITFRRDTGSGKEKLEATQALVMQGKDEVLRIHFPEGVSKVAWNEISDLPDLLKMGLPQGNYQLRLPSPTGVDLASFTVIGTEKRDELLHHELTLRRYLNNSDELLFTQVAIEKLIEQDPPYLCDSLDLLDEVPESNRTARLTILFEYIQKRLKLPDEEAGLPVLINQATGDPEIDAVRSLIAAGYWDKALNKVEEIKKDIDSGSRRRIALAHLYHGVILSESGQGKESESITLFSTAIAAFNKIPDSEVDLFRAHFNLASFLLGRSQDRLYNHAFQIASGVRLPLLTALRNWSDAKSHYEQAIKYASDISDKAAIELNLARSYLLLGDIVETLSDPSKPDEKFTFAVNAARQYATVFAQKLVENNVLKQTDPLIVAVANEVIAQIATRKEDLISALKYCQEAYKIYFENGSLVGLESTSRLMGLCNMDLATGINPAGSLQYFQISEQISEILRGRIPSDNSGLSRSGFFARRAFVTDHIVDLLIAQQNYQEALYHIEKCKSQTLQDILSERIQLVSESLTFTDDKFLSNWPKDVSAIEYYFGNKRVWVFIIDTTGKVSARILKDESGKPISPRRLVSRIHNYISYLELLGPGNISRIGEGKRIAYGGKFDWSWQDELFALYQILLPDDTLQILKSTKKCVIIPHNILHYFPFAALVTKKDERTPDATSMPLPKFLIDESFVISYAPSLRTYQTLRSYPVRPLDVINAVGVVDFDGLAKSLPGVNKEIANIHSVFGNKVRSVLMNEEVTTSKVLELLDQPGMLSIGTHGMKIPDFPLESYLVCRSDEKGVDRLTAAEIYSSSVNNDLVVLNACYGGFGDRSPLPGDDLFGIQRALIHSGARTVVSGLWDVYDSTTPEIIGEFYREIARGKSASKSLAVSQRAYLKKWRTSTLQQLRFLTHPYYWAVFTVVGDDRTGEWNSTNSGQFSYQSSVLPASKPVQINRRDFLNSPRQITANSLESKSVRLSKSQEIKLSTNKSRTETSVASHNTETNNLAIINDPAFGRYIDFRFLAHALDGQSPSGLVDAGLQLAEGERVLGRVVNVKGITSERIFLMAAELASENDDKASLARLKKISESSGSKSLTDALSSNEKLDGQSRSLVMDGSIPLSMPSEVIESLKYYSNAIRQARILRNLKSLKSLTEELKNEKGLPEAQEKQLNTLAAETLSTVEKNPGPEDDGLVLLMATSRLDELPYDPFFDRYVPHESLVNALSSMDSDKFADLAIQAKDGERALFRERQGVSAKALWQIAIRLAEIQGNGEALRRLNSAADRFSIKEFQDRLQAAIALAGESRGEDDSLTINPLEITEEDFAVLKEYSWSIDNAILRGDLQYLDDVRKNIEALYPDSPALRKAIEKLLKRRASQTAKESLDSEISENLDMLMSDSRGGFFKNPLKATESFLKNPKKVVTRDVNNIQKGIKHTGKDVERVFTNAEKELNKAKDYYGAKLSEEAWGEFGRIFYPAGAKIQMDRYSSYLQPLTSDEKNILAPIFGQGLVNTVQIAYGVLPISDWSWQGETHHIPIGETADAQTFGHKIYIRHQRQSLGDYARLILLIHELTHSQQYEKWGRSLPNFGYHYFKNYKKVGLNYSKIQMELEANSNEKKILNGTWNSSDRRVNFNSNGYATLAVPRSSFSFRYAYNPDPNNSESGALIVTDSSNKQINSKIQWINANQFQWVTQSGIRNYVRSQ